MDKLPLEILLLILGEDLLPDSSILALRQTCRRFRSLLQLPECFIPRPPSPTDDLKDNRDKLEFLNMLQRDSSVHGIRMCDRCLRLHLPNKYTQEELRENPVHPQCLYSYKIWMCNGRQVSFDAGREILANFERSDFKIISSCRHCHPRISSRLYKDEKSSQLAQRIDLQLMISDKSIRVLTISAAKQHFATQSVQSRLQGICLPVCSHIRHSNPWVANFYDPDHLELRKHLGLINGWRRLG